MTKGYHTVAGFFYKDPKSFEPFYIFYSMQGLRLKIFNWLVVSTPLKHIILVKLDHFPKVRGNNNNKLKPPPTVDGWNPAPPGMVKTL